MSHAETADLFRRIGTDRVLFGSNYPFVSQADYVEVMETIPLTEDEGAEWLAELRSRLWPTIKLTARRRSRVSEGT